MAIVSLKRDWFDPEGKLWSARNNPHEMDDALVEQLPSDAVVDDGESQEQGLKEKKREEKLLQEAESKANDVKHAAVVHKTATPAKL